MSNLVNITITEEEYQKLLLTDFKNTPTISVKVMADDLELKDDETYKALIKTYKKARNTMEEYRFNKLTNK
jgi:hypothetical protein